MIINKKFINRIKQRDEEAFYYLYTEYKEMIHYISMSIIKDEVISQDIEQEVFMNIIKGIDSFDAKKANFKTWIANITRNKAIDEYRKRYNKPYINDNELIDNSSVKNTNTNLEIKDLQNFMSFDQYLILILKIVYGWRHKQIAIYLGLTIDVCKKEYKKAMDIAREVLR